jgi:hypothetical protein
VLIALSLLNFCRVRLGLGFNCHEQYDATDDENTPVSDAVDVTTRLLSGGSTHAPIGAACYDSMMQL